MTIAAAQPGMTGSAKAQSGNTKPADLPAIKAFAKAVVEVDGFK